MKPTHFTIILLSLIYCSTSYILPTNDHEENSNIHTLSLVNNDLYKYLKNNNDIQSDRHILIIDNRDHNTSITVPNPNISMLLTKLAWGSMLLDQKTLNDMGAIQAIIDQHAEYFHKAKVVFIYHNMQDIFPNTDTIHETVLNNFKCMLEIINKKNNLFLFCTVSNSTDVHPQISNLFKLQVKLPSIDCDALHEQHDAMHKKNHTTIILRGVELQEGNYFD